MKHLLFKVIVSLWRLYPFKKGLSKLILRSNYLKNKLYKDLRFVGNFGVELKDGDFEMYNPGYTTIENELFWNGIEGWEKVSIDIWQTLSKDARLILDIGANTGVYSLIAATINPDATIIAFEPVQRTSELFKKNLALNSNFQIELVNKAISNKNGEALFYDVDTISQYSASLNEKMLEDLENRVSYTVEVICIDNLDLLIGNKVDLIKLDVEMHEPEAIEGMLNTIKRDKPSILVEILTDEIGKQIQELLKNEDYSFYSIDEVNPPKKVMNLKKSDHYNYLLIHTDKESGFTENYF